MRNSYEGIGQWAATFACGEVREGEAVQISESGTVSACQQGGRFGGVVLSRSRDGAACAVALGGMATVSYSGTAPTAGWCALRSDGSGGVETGGGQEYLVADVDESAQTVTFVL